MKKAVPMHKIGNIKNLGKAFFNYQLGKVTSSHYPLQIWIEPTSYCNLKCIMCPNPNLNKSQLGHMPFERFQKIVDSIYPYVNSVSICHRGEPLLHREICKMIGYACRRGLNTAIATNATLLNEELSKSLIKSGLSRISFSFDGYTKEDYERIRVGARFEEVLSNIGEFLKIKQVMKSKTPYTTLQVIDFGGKKNRVEEKKKFMKPFDGLPLDRFYVNPIHNWAGSLSQGNGCKARLKKGNCNSPWYSLIIHWDGTVYPCCPDYIGKYHLGHIDYDSWLDIWNGERMRNLRLEMASGKFEKCRHCLQCDKLYEKKFLGVSTEKLFNETLFRLKWSLRR